MPGKVTITLKDAILTRKEEQFKSMNPWAVVMFEGQKKITQPVDKGNLEPQFNQTWTFQRSADVKIQLSIFKKEQIIDAFRNPKEQDLLIGKGTVNIMSTLKKAIKKPLDVIVDLYYDFDNKVAGQAHLAVQFTPVGNLEEYKQSQEEKLLKAQYSSQLVVSNMVLTLKNFDAQSDYYVKVRNSTSTGQTEQVTGSASMRFSETSQVYFRGQKIVYFDVQQLIKDEVLGTIIGDDLVGICILDEEKCTQDGEQTLVVKQRGKNIGQLKCKTQFESWEKKKVEIEGESQLDIEKSIIRQSSQDIRTLIKQREKKEKFWLSPERYALDKELKKNDQLERRSMLMKRHNISCGALLTSPGKLNPLQAATNTTNQMLDNSSMLFRKNEDKNLLMRKDIVLSTTTVKLPNLKTNNHVLVPTEFDKKYFRDVHGIGFSTLESSSTLQYSVPKFSIPESKRFLDPSTISPGPGQYCSSGVADDNFNAKKFKIVTGINEVRTVKQQRNPRVNVDSGLKITKTAAK